MSNKVNNYKQRVTAAFNHTVSTYDQAAILQYKVGQHLLEMLPSSTDLQRIVDLGSGTGKTSSLLAQIFPDVRVFGIDIAIEMIRFSRNNYSKTNLDFLCADADYLPLADKSIQLIFSNLMLQWSNDLAITLNELYRVLDDGGKVRFSILGAESLYELKAAWEKIDSNRHVNNFTSKPILINQLAQAGFKKINIDTIQYYRFFDSIINLLLELKKTGANTIKDNYSTGLFGRRKLKLLQESYAQFCSHQQKLRLTYEVYYVKATK